MDYEISGTRPRRAIDRPPVVGLSSPAPPSAHQHVLAPQQNHIRAALPTGLASLHASQEPAQQTDHP
jgi:hypothetical protein